MNEEELQGLMTELGANTPPPEDTPPEQVQSPEGTTPPEGAQGAEGEQKPPEQTEEPKANNVKANNAFAQMRIANQKYEKTLKSIASVLGVEDTDDMDGLLAAFQEKAINKQAEDLKVPPELLSRLQTAEERLRDFEAERNTNNAYLGFQRVKDEYGLTDKELGEFAATLNEKGLNPFEQPVNLMDQYKLLNYDRLIQKAKDDAIKAELERRDKAKQQASNPGGRQSSTGSSDQTDKINSVSELDNFIKKLGV